MNFIPMPSFLDLFFYAIVGIPLILFGIWAIRSVDEDKKDLEKTKKQTKKEKTPTKEKKLVEKVDEVGDSLMSKVSRLKRLYNNGTLTKAEFEQAKNKLLK